MKIKLYTDNYLNILDAYRERQLLFESLGRIL